MNANAPPQDAHSLTTAPLLIIRPRSGWAALNLAEVWQFRDLLFSLAGRDIKLRYRQTALGAIWVVLQPLITAGIFAFVFGAVAKLPTEGVPTFLLSYAGMLGWNIFAGTVSRAGTCLVGNSQLISKVYFPRLVLPLSTLFSTWIDFAVAMAMMVALFAGSHRWPGAPIVLLPVWLVLISLLALGIGLWTAALMVSYRDVGYVVPILIQFLMYASPVGYLLARVPEPYRVAYSLNPLVALLEACHWSLVRTNPPQLGWLVYSASCSVGVFVIGALVFRRMERRFADVI